MKVSYHSALLYILFSSLTAASPTPPETVKQLSIKFDKSMSALAAEYSRNLIKYLSKNPSADDFLEGLKALENIGASDKEIGNLHDAILKRSKQAEAKLANSNDPEQSLLYIDELLVLGAYTNLDDVAKLDLLEKKYTIVAAINDKENRDEEAFGDDGVVRAIVSYHQEKRQKQQGIDFINRVKKDFPDSDAEALNHVEKLFSAMDAVGDPFPLHFKSLTGEEIDIANLKGKVVLVDFWATWCGPCMRDLPKVIALYEKFHGQGMEIIGVSLDKDRNAVEKIVQSKKIPWPQFFDGKVWDNELAKAHGITAIPANFIIDQDSKLAAVDLRGTELEAKVAELLQRK